MRYRLGDRRYVSLDLNHWIGLAKAARGHRDARYVELLEASTPKLQITEEVLALSVLLLIGMSLIGEGLGVHIPKGYIYFAMGFSVFVEMINLRLRRRTAPLHLKERYTNDGEATP